jgi:SpoIID/LytB domain protein
VPLPARVLAKAVVGAAVALLAMIATGSRWAPQHPFAVAAQSELSEIDLDRASSGRTVVVGSPAAGGRPTAVPLEVYVARVLAGEGEPNAADGASQALAIAIRTYATVKAGTHRRDGYDVCDTTHCQVPRASTPASRRAAMTTAGRILTYRGSPAEVFYSASCGGRSESASAIWSGTDFPYLRTVADDVHDADEPWTLELPLVELQRALERAGFEGSRLRDVRVDAHTVSGRVKRLALPGLRPDAIAGDQFRMLVGATRLRSTAFSITRTGDTLRFSGRGYGHGVGMCVIGAGRRARRGDDATAILATYYPGLTITRIDDLPPAPTVSTGVRPGVRPEQRSAQPSGVAVAPTPSAVTLPAIAPAGSNSDIDRLVATAQVSLSRTLGTTIQPVTVTVHSSLESFRAATGRPWWVTAVAAGRSVDIAPLPLVAQRDGIAMAVRAAVAELMVAEALADRPAWVRVGAARYFARPKAIDAPGSRPKCPADAELTLAISVAAQRDAEAQAERCFAYAFARTGSWRDVR